MTPRILDHVKTWREWSAESYDCFNANKQLRVAQLAQSFIMWWWTKVSFPSVFFQSIY